MHFHWHYKLGRVFQAKEYPIFVYTYQFSHSVVSDSLQPHGPQHTRLPCLSPAPGAYSSSCPSSQWCHPTILSFVVPFSSCLQSFPASGSFPVSQFFVSGGQNWSFSFSIRPSNEYSELISFRMDWITGLELNNRKILPDPLPCYTF